MSEYLLILVVLIFPIGWYLTGKTYSEKGLFGLHACRWLNGCTFGIGKLRKGEINNDGTQAYYCDYHWIQRQAIKKMVERKCNNE